MALMPNNNSSGNGVYDEEGAASHSPTAETKAKTSPAKSLSGEELKKAEAQPSDTIGGGYKPGKPSARERLRASFTPKTKKRLMIGGGIGGVAVVGFTAAFLALVPLKIVGITNDAQSHFFSTTDSAVSKQTDNLFSYYVKKHVLPSLKGKYECQSTLRNKDCIRPGVSGSSQVSKLYAGWSDARLENKLADKYGIEFELKGSTYNMKVPGESVVDVSDLMKPGNNKTLTDLSTSQVRARVHAALESETFATKSLYRFKVGRLMEKKYGIKRCVVACDTKDTFADWKSNQKKAYKTYLSERVLAPLSEGKSLILECILNGGCDQPGSDGPNGEKRDQMQEKLSQKLATYQEKYGAQAVTKIIEDSNLILERGFASYAAEKVVSKVFADAGAGAAAGTITEEAVPVIGWVDTGAKIINTTATAGPKLKKWSFITNSTAMVAFYQMYRTHADEIKSGHVDAGLVGSFSSALGSGTKKDGTGGAAEDSPLYASLFGKSSGGKTTAMLSGVLGGTANAAPQEKCDDGSSIPAGQLICPEESLKTSNILTDVSSFFDKQPWASLKTVAGAEQAVSSKFSTFLSEETSKVLQALPGYAAATEAIGNQTKPFVDGISKKLLVSPFSDDMSGARNFDMIAGGADVEANEFASSGLGGQHLTNGQVAEIRNDQLNQAQQTFKQQPFFARMFDSSSQYSFVSRLAVAMPSNLNDSIKFSFGSFMSNPFGTIVKGFGSILSPNHAFAATTPADDPFSVPQAGYALNNPVFTTDPDTYTPEYCKQLTDTWNRTTTVDADTGMDIHTTSNPCMLNDTAIAAAGAVFTDSVLAPGDVSSAGSGGTTTGSQGQLAPGALSWPTDVKGSLISQCVGRTDASGHILSGGHPGVDIAAKLETPIYASADGTLSFAGPTDGYGNNFVIIKHHDGMYTSYGHMNSMIFKAGEKDTAIKQGQQIGTMGSQGKSTGSHLHFNLTLGTDVFAATQNGNVDPFKNGLQIPAGVPNPAGCTN